MKKSHLTASLENYLCAIYKIAQKNGVARVKEIAQELGYGAPTVSETMKILEKGGYINYEPYGAIALTEKGESVVLNKLKRREIIENFLSDVLMVKDESIAQNVKTIEHGLSEDVLIKFVRFLTFMQTCSCKEPKWIKSFKHFAQEGKLQDRCNSCIEKCKNGETVNCCSKN